MVLSSSSTSTTTEQEPPAPQALLLTADTWWDVIPGRKQGVTPLLERCKRLLAWGDAYTTLVSTAYREFLECKAFVRDWDNADKLSPSIPVDQMWHQHILDSKNYRKDCKLLFGRVIHHNPDGDMDARARSIRISSTKALLSARNGPEILNSRAWDFGLVVAAAAPTENSNMLQSSNSGGGGPLSGAAAAAAAESQLLSPRRTRAASPSSPHDTATERSVRARHDDPPEEEEEVVEEDEEEEENNNNGERIPFQVYNQTGEGNFFTIKKTTKMEYLFKFYAKRKGICPDNLTFMLHGEKLLPHETPLQIKHISNQNRLDVLDVMFRHDEEGNNEIITLRVRDQTGEETFFKIKKTTKLGKSFETYAKRKGVRGENLRWMLDGERLYPYQTPLLLNLDDQNRLDVLDVIMFRHEERNNEITLRVRDQTGEETFFKMKMTTELGKVFETYAKRKGVCWKNLRFMFNGETLYPYQTPLLLNLDDQGQIDCMLVQMGC